MPCTHHTIAMRHCAACRASPVGGCPDHPETPPVTFCPKCRGSKGGKVVTPAKVRSLTRTAIQRERTRRQAKRHPKPEGGNET